MDNINIFQFLIDFGQVIFNWTGQLWTLLNSDFTIPFTDPQIVVKVWQIMGVAGAVSFIILAVIRGIVKL